MTARGQDSITMRRPALVHDYREERFGRGGKLHAPALAASLPSLPNYVCVETSDS
jgi:hypothetical protein